MIRFETDNYLIGWIWNSDIDESINMSEFPEEDVFTPFSDDKKKAVRMMRNVIQKEKRNEFSKEFSIILTEDEQSKIYLESLEKKLQKVKNMGSRIGDEKTGSSENDENEMGFDDFEQDLLPEDEELMMNQDVDDGSDGIVLRKGITRKNYDRAVEMGEVTGEKEVSMSFQEGFCERLTSFTDYIGSLCRCTSVEKEEEHDDGEVAFSRI